MCRVWLGRTCVVCHRSRIGPVDTSDSEASEMDRHRSTVDYETAESQESEEEEPSYHTAED